MSMKKLKRALSVFICLAFVLSCLPATFARAESPAPDDDGIYAYRPTPGDSPSRRYTMKVNGTQVFVTDYSKVSVDNVKNDNADVSRFVSESATPVITLTNNEPVTSVKVYPERYYPASAITVDGNTVTFQMSEQLRYALVEINGKRPVLGIINDPPEDPTTIPDPSAPNVLNLKDFRPNIDDTGMTNVNAEIVAAITELYSNPAYDTLYIPDGYYLCSGISLQNRTKPVTIYTEEGARLKSQYTLSGTRGSTSSAINIRNSENIAFYGRGIFDANGFEAWARMTGIARAAGVYVGYSKNISLNDTYLRDSSNWSFETHAVTDVNYNNIKSLSPYFGSWIDGVNIASGKNVSVNGAFTLMNDDAFATGHYSNANEGDSENISVKNTLHWTVNAGNAARFGHSTLGNSLKSYYFENFNAVNFCAGFFGITVQNNTGTYPRYEDIQFKNCSFDTSRVYTNFSVMGASGERGDSIENVVLENCWFSDWLPSAVSNVNNLTLKNIYVAGEKAASYGAAALTLDNVLNVTTDMAEDFAPVFTSVGELPPSGLYPPGSAQESFEPIWFPPIGKLTATEGAPVAFTVSATDPEGKPVTYEVEADTMPAGASFNPTTAAFSWTPAEGQYGMYPVTFRAHDEYAYGKMTVNIFVDSDKIVNLEKLDGTEIFGRTADRNNDERNNPPEGAFDGDILTQYYGYIDTWTGIKLDSPYHLLGFSYLTGRANNFRILANEIQGSVDGENWDTLDIIWENPPEWISKTGAESTWVAPPLKQVWFRLAERPAKAYTYYRICSGMAPYCNPGEIEFYGVAAESDPEKYVSMVPTPQDSDLINPNYDRSYDNVVVQTDGFVHPGYILTREDLNVMRDMVWLGKSPWKESFELLMTSPYASPSYRTLGASPDLVGESQLYTMFQDMTAAFYLSVMWYVTGDKPYADRAIELLMDWSETCVQDSRRDLIRNGHGMQKAAMAAEILRYTPSSGWSKENTAKLTAFMKLLQPGVDRPDGYFNQGLYALSGWMGIAIFTNDRAMYETGVERAVHNVQGGSNNFSFSSILLDSGQIVELGRDFVHSVDDVRLLPIIAQALYAQGTKVRLEGSAVAITPDGEDLYEFQNQKLLKAMAYISKHGLGQEVAWYRENGWGGSNVPFSRITTDRAPFTGMMPAYNHYRYIKGYAPGEQRTDPYMQDPDGRYLALYGGDTSYNALYEPIETMAAIGGMEGMEFDFLGCGDLFFTPWFTADGGPGAGAPNRLPVVEDLYDVYIRQEGGIFDAADCESTPGNPPSFESFTDEDGVARNNLANTHLYSWVAYEVDFTDRYGSTVEKLVDTFTMAHSHSGPVGAASAHNMIMYVGPYVENPTAETFAAAKEITAVSGEIARNTYRNNGGFWTDYMADSIRLSSSNPALLTGKKTVYMYFTTSTSNYQLHTNVLWFKFSGGSAKNTDGNSPADADVLSASGAVKDGGGVTLTDGGSFGFYNLDFDKGFDAWSFTYQASGGGSLKLVTGDPNSGTLVKTMEIEATQGVVTTEFDHTGQVSPRGLHDAYMVYEGEGSVTVTSFRSRDGKVFLPHSGDSYRNVAYGKAEKAGDGAAKLAVLPGGRTRVGYYFIPFLEGPKTLNIRVRSDVAATLTFSMLESLGGAVARFDVPDTAGISADGWTSMQYVLGAAHSALKADQNIMLTVTGDEAGTVELDSWWLSYDVFEAPEFTLSPDLNDLVLFPGLSLELEIAEKGGSPVVVGALPAGAGFADGKLAWTVTESDVGAGVITFAASNTGGTATFNLRYTVFESLEAALAEARVLYDETKTYTIESKVRYLSALADLKRAVARSAPYQTVYELIGAFKARASELRVFEPVSEGLIDYIQLKDSIAFSIFHGLNTTIDGVTYNGPISSQSYILNTLDISKLIDDTSGTYIEIRPRAPREVETATDTRAHITMDFGAGVGVILSKTEVQARQGQTARTNGVLVRGSNDGVSWVDLTTAFSNTAPLQTREVTDETPYRYIRVVNPNGTDANANYFLSIAEYHIYGTTVQNPTVTAADVANGITSVRTPGGGEIALELPWVPEGFGISLKSSSDERIVALDGEITPRPTDTVVNVVFTVTKAGTAESADTVSIPVLVPGTGMNELSVSVSTPTIVTTLAAHLNIAVENAPEGVALKAYLMVDGEALHETAVVNGAGRMYIYAAPGAGTYQLVVIGEGYEGSCEIEGVPYNTNIWEANAQILDGKLLIRFNDDIVLKSSSGCVSIKGVSYNARVLEDKRTIEVLKLDAGPLEKGTKISVKGVKYPVLFPSYSFTFTVTVP